MYTKQTLRWIDLLPEALFAYRITVGVTKQTPFEIFFARRPNYVYSYPGTVVQEDQNSGLEFDREKIQAVHENLLLDVRTQREANAVKMKERWDTSNTQMVLHSFLPIIFFIIFFVNFNLLIHLG